MNRLKKTLFILFFFVCFFRILAQKDSSVFQLGINAIPLRTGTPELQLDYFPLRSWGISANVGYTDKAVRGGFIKVGDQSEINSLYGTYFKLGVKGRFPLQSKSGLTFFAQALYVFSSYSESGYRRNMDASVDQLHYKGFVNGVAIALGFDVRVWKMINLRAATQMGAYGKRAHLGYPGHTFQPGLGASGMLFNNQLTLGLVAKL